MTPEMTSRTPAQGFRAEHDHYREDSGFWQRHAVRTGGPVLDLGAAAGRTAVPVAQAGVDVVALDSDAEMLEVLMAHARASGVSERITCIVGDMATTPLPADLALVMVPMNTLQVLVTHSARQQVFANVKAALRPGGEFIFDLSVPDLDDIAHNLHAVIPTATHIDSDTGDVLVHTATYDALDRSTHTLAFRVMIDRTDANGVTTRYERPHVVHLYDPRDVRELLEWAGLGVVSVHAGFHDEPFDADHAERHVWRARKPQVRA